MVVCKHYKPWVSAVLGHCIFKASGPKAESIIGPPQGQ